MGFVALLLYLLYKQTLGVPDSKQLFTQFLGQLNSIRWLWLLAVLLLLPLNWALEALKLKVLMRPFWAIPFWSSFKAILCGVSLSLITPNRIGEYGGRILAVPAQYNWHTALATLVGSFSQILVLLSGGLIGLLFYLNLNDQVDQLPLLSLWLISSLALGLLYFFFFRIDLLLVLLPYLPLPQWLKLRLEPVKALAQYPGFLLRQSLWLSFLRYTVYSFQYFFTLKFFAISVPVGAAFSGIATIFLVQTSVPLPPLAAVLARGEIALQVWGKYAENDWQILAAVFVLFIINLAVPALLGVLLIVKINILKSLGYEKKRVDKKLFHRIVDIPHGLHVSRKDNAQS